MSPWNLKKLRSVTLKELYGRGRQIFAAFAERNGWTTSSRLPTDAVLLTRLDLTQRRSLESWFSKFQTQTEPRFFQSFCDSEGSVRQFRATWPEAEFEIVRRADFLQSGFFDLLGFKSLSFGKPIDWHKGPISGKTSPLVHWSRLLDLNEELSSERKVLWELNRHQHFVTFGQAYWLTENEKYAQAFVDQVNSWMDQNPPKLGANWSSSLEIAFRSISWLWALHFFKESQSLTSDTFIRIMKFMYVSARHIETYLSTYFSPNTHLTGEALGLFYIGTMFPEFKEARRWRSKGLSIMIEQLPIHVKPDGVYFEQSSYYHRYTADFYFHLFLLLQQNNRSIPSILGQKLNSLLDHLMYITLPDGTTPFFGDDDGGRLVMLASRAANDFRDSLSIGAALFGRSDLKYVAGAPSQETLWLMGVDGLGKLFTVDGSEPTAQSVGFRTGGYYVMRDSWTSKANYLLFDCGPLGTLNCGHAHADALAFDLAANGQTLLVDPGTYTYLGSKEARDWFRSSEAHNTLLIDDQPSSEPDRAFSWKTKAGAEEIDWITRDRFDYVQGKHDGYLRLPHPAIHSRAILFLKKDYWIVRDRVESRGPHKLSVQFHVASSTDSVSSLPASAEGSILTLAMTGKPLLDIAVFGKTGQWKTETGWVSSCFGDRKPAPTYLYSTTEAKEIISFLVPRFDGRTSQPTVREIEAIGGCAFEVLTEKGHDIVMIKDDYAQVDTARMASDCDWTWLRFSQGRDDDTLPQEVVLIGGQTLAVEGRQLVRSGRPIKYLVAKQNGPQFELDTDESVLVLDLPFIIFEPNVLNANQEFMTEN